MKISTELEILIESIKVSLLEKPSNRLIYLLENQSVNWNRFEKMATYHSIRPVVYDAFRKINFQNEYTENLKTFVRSQTIINLSTKQELTRLFLLFSDKNIRVLPYKGLIFISEIYQNKQLREVGDLDLLFHPNDAKKALEILFEDGYTFSFSEEILAKNSNSDLVNDIFAQHGWHEVGLDKLDINGLNIHIDFHWGLYFSFFSYQINLEDFFTKTIEKDNLVLPSTQTIFLMLLTHHGAREFWLKLKFLADLLMFFREKSVENLFEALQNEAKKSKMETSMGYGLILLDVIFDFKIEERKAEKFVKRERITKKIINYWEDSVHYDKLKPRLKYEYFLVSMQDKDFSIWKYTINFLKLFSYPNLIESPRIITFPRKYPILNLISKIISYILKKSFKQNT